MNRVILLSGGMDSITLMYYIKSQVPNDDLYAIFFDYGQRSLQNEWNWAKEHTEKLGVPLKLIEINLDYTNNRMISKFAKDATATDELPLRNLIFLSYGLSYLRTLGGEGTVCIGLIDPPEDAAYEDSTPEFIESLGVMAESIEAPFSLMSKLQVAELALELGLDIARTVSCNHMSGGYPCGNCADCVARDAVVKEILKDK